MKLMSKISPKLECNQECLYNAVMKLRDDKLWHVIDYHILRSRERLFFKEIFTIYRRSDSECDITALIERNSLLVF